MNETPIYSNNKLPVKRILILSFQLIKQRPVAFIRMGLPLLLFILIFVLSNFFLDKSINFEFGIIYTIFILSIFWFTIVMVVVGCHRTFLTNRENIHQIKSFRWQAREWKFVGWGLIVGFFIAILYWIWGFIIFSLGMIQIGSPLTTAIIFQVLILPITYLFSRWSLVFPATALEDPDASIADAWLLSDENGWRLTFLIIVVPFIFDLLFSIVMQPNSLIWSIIMIAIWLVIAVYQIGLLSLSYAFLKGSFRSDANIEV